MHTWATTAIACPIHLVKLLSFNLNNFDFILLLDGSPFVKLICLCSRQWCRVVRPCLDLIEVQPVHATVAWLPTTLSRSVRSGLRNLLNNTFLVPQCNHLDNLRAQTRSLAKYCCYLSPVWVTANTSKSESGVNTSLCLKKDGLHQLDSVPMSL